MWIFECEYGKRIFQFDEHNCLTIDDMHIPSKYQRELMECNDCECGKNCKPIKVELMMKKL